MKSDFDSVGDFHKKFGVPVYDGEQPTMIHGAMLEFRIKFMIEELREYAEACGYNLEVNVHRRYLPNGRSLPLAADSLVDLSYVVLGTAHLHNLPWPALFAEVQRANMSKIRCGINHLAIGEPNCETCGKPSVLHSKRGSELDVIKPPGWTPPDIDGVLRKNGWEGE